MALNLLEMKKLVDDPLTIAIIEEFSTGDIMATVPFDTISGSGVFYNRQQLLPGIAFRGINEAYAEGVGILNPQSEALKICGGDLDVDVALIKMGGASVRSTHEKMKLQNIRMTWEQKFIKGDSTVDPREFDGLQKRVTGSQLISNNDAGGPLKLTNLDSAISQVRHPTHLIMSRKMRDLLTASSRGVAIGGYIVYEQDQFGRKLAHYGGLPILIDDISNPVLPFTEASPDGTSSVLCSSIYVVSFGSQMVSGIQNGILEARDLGEVQDAPVFRTRVEWLNAFAIYNGYSVCRLAGITNTAVVV
jgi:hypothetical protein